MNPEKPEEKKIPYEKPRILLTYQAEDLEKEFADVFGQTFVDLFGPRPPGPPNFGSDTTNSK